MNEGIDEIGFLKRTVRRAELVADVIVQEVHLSGIARDMLKRQIIHDLISPVVHDVGVNLVARMLGDEGVDEK